MNSSTEKIAEVVDISVANSSEHNGPAALIEQTEQDHGKKFKRDHVETLSIHLCSVSASQSIAKH